MHGFAGFVAQRAQASRAAVRRPERLQLRLASCTRRWPSVQLRVAPISTNSRSAVSAATIRCTVGRGKPVALAISAMPTGSGLSATHCSTRMNLENAAVPATPLSAELEVEAGVAEDMRGTCVSGRGCGRADKEAGGKAGQHNPPLTPARPCCLSRLKTTLGHHVSPSTGSTTPVMKAAAGVHRNTAARATSSGVPQRASGVRARMGPARAGSSCSAWVSGVAIQPGATALTRMPSGA